MTQPVLRFAPSPNGRLHLGHAASALENAAMAARLSARWRAAFSCARSTADTSRAVQLVGNFPNPFSETTTIAYEVHEPVPVTVSVWTVTGTRVRTITDQHHEPGRYERQFRASSLPSGPYFVQLKTPRGTQSNRMVVLK